MYLFVHGLCSLFTYVLFYLHTYYFCCILFYKHDVLFGGYFDNVVQMAVKILQQFLKTKSS